MNIIQEALKQSVVATQKNLAPVEHIKPFFEWDSFSDEIMEKMGFKITRLIMSLTKEKWLCVSADWKLEDEQDRGYMVKYPKENGNSSSWDEQHVEFFFSEIESDPEAYRASYSDTERFYNGFGKVSFELGIQINPDYYEKNNHPQIGYEYAYSQNTKYGVCVYFKPCDFGLTDRILFKYDEDEEKVENNT